MEKKNREKDVRTRVPLERLHTRNKKDTSQDKCAHSHYGKRQQDRQPPPLKAAAQELINDDIRSSTKKTYKSKVGVFATYCTKEGTNTKSCHPNVVINFFMMLARDKGLSYQIICGYRSAIARQHISVGGTLLGLLPEIKRLAQPIFIDRPPLPRYTDCWDVNRVLEHLETGPSLTDLSDMDLSVMTATITFILKFDNMNDG